ncbi:MAG: hypothetical protein IMW90_03625 [Thermogemmatispora sp.]|uniref:Uncharacterized protein n=1 Tax=Thermogemmatispora aurantia TaxID=2045279 RepID=A0A5J4K2G8_9CHLR|nr:MULTISPECIES: hypothetical protein [Thermogemmatispora]MBE3564798.1 hypothetical protein [Thermogemmatispora sp.]GER81853.1 hypothetical protein KTAU_04910 [Thermogemmatispora aurantia]
MLEQWEALVTHFSGVTDRLGKGIDEEIFETVVTLNAVGLPTIMSCGGHLDERRGLLLPWVDIGPQDSEFKALVQEEQELVLKVSLAHQHLSALREQEHCEESLLAEVQSQVYELARRMREAQRQLLIWQIPLRTRLVRYLNQFYEGRMVPFDRHLILAPGLYTRLQSQGAIDLYLEAPRELQRQKLEEYRQEMHEFTAFLKQLYFSGQIDQHGQT